MTAEIVLSDRCRPTRAAVGPVAWIVLEELAAVGEPSGSTVRASTTVRRLGATLGLSKDTVAAALRRLIADGLVQRFDERNRPSGHFGGCVYVVDLHAIGLTQRPTRTPQPGSSDTAVSARADAPAPTRTAETPAPAPARRTRRSATPGQLSLLDTGTAT